MSDLDDEDMKDGTAALAEADTTVRLEHAPDVATGQWYWIKGVKKDDVDGDGKGNWLGCVVKIGSNYVKAESPHGGTARIHFSKWYAATSREMHPERVIGAKVNHFRAESERLMVAVKEVTALIGMAPSQQDPSTTALATITSQHDPVLYKKALIKAKDKTLPELFQELEATHKSMAVWMKAQTIPLKAEVAAMQKIVEGIDDRIFSVSIYAGLAEEVEQIREGDPAAPAEKLHVMQRMVFMDEESLLGYEHGGMDFDTVKDFDRWLAKPPNANRLLPFPRCLVAVQVRRKEKHRETDGTLASVWVKVQMAKADKKTFLYLRNGERLYRLDCDLDFDLMIFPNRSEFLTGEPVMVYTGHPGGGAPQMERDDDGNRRVARLQTMPRVTWEAKKAEEEAREAEEAAWAKANPREPWEAAENRRRYEAKLQERLAERAAQRAAGKRGFKNSASRHQRWRGKDRRDQVSSWDWQNANPHHDRNGFDYDRWQPFDDSYLYYDECMQTIKRRVDYYNRVSVLIQGLFDRSEVFHPHPPVHLWTPAGFEAAVKLVYDGEMTLYAGEAPDLESYLAANRNLITTTSVLFDPDDVWARHEADKDAERSRSPYRSRHHRPPGNPGPGQLARPARVSAKARTATFTWFRERQRDGSWRTRKRAGDRLATKITIPFDKLFNVSAYKPGDYLPFFQDPRTREQYLRWADMFLTAEEWHAKNAKLKVQDPGAAPPKPKPAKTTVCHWMKRTKEDWTMERGFCGKPRGWATSDLDSVTCKECLAKAKAAGHTTPEPATHAHEEVDESVDDDDDDGDDEGEDTDDE